MPNIGTLVKDIYDMMEGKRDPILTEQVVDAFAQDVAGIIKDRLMSAKDKRGHHLRMSQLGTECHRKLWYQYNQPEKAEPIQPWTLIKFLYGDVIEALFLMLAEAAGHEVKGRQTTLVVEGVPGHRDCIIDGHLVDVKSANSRGFVKFKQHELEKDDPFGYLTQLNLYLLGSQDDPDLEDKRYASFLAVDKELGHVVLDTYEREHFVDYNKKVTDIKSMVLKPSAPERCYEPVPDGKSGNLALGLTCRYCDHKRTCWPGMRTFMYSNGPKFLVEVKREPDVPEIK